MTVGFLARVASWAGGFAAESLKGIDFSNWPVFISHEAVTSGGVPSIISTCLRILIAEAQAVAGVAKGMAKFLPKLRLIIRVKLVDILLFLVSAFCFLVSGASDERLFSIFLTKK